MQYANNNNTYQTVFWPVERWYECCFQEGFNIRAVCQESILCFAEQVD